MDNIHVNIGASADDAETGATFNSNIENATIPDSPGVGSEPQSQTNAPRNSMTPLSQDVDPIHDYEEPEDFIKSAPLMPGRESSASSDADAGLNSDLELPEETPGAVDLRDEEAFSLESANLDEDLDAPLVEEIPMDTLDIEGIDDAKTKSTLGEGEMDPPNVPGEVDIEALGDNAIEDLLPPDARLDPIEE